MTSTLAELLEDLTGVPTRIVDDPSKANDYSGDLYGLELTPPLPRLQPRPALDDLEKAPLWRPEKFLMPGNQPYASGAHHRHPLSLNSWSASGLRGHGDGTLAPTALALVWDSSINGPASAHLACSTDVVSARCITSSKPKGERIYTVQHRYRMPVRMLVKGFRCPACTVDQINKTRAKSSKHIGWSLTLAQIPYVLADWSVERNWPVPPEHTPAVRDRFVDLECRTCGYFRINFGDKLAGNGNGQPQGCPRCRQGSVSIDEKVIADVLTRWAAPGVVVTPSESEQNTVIDVALRLGDTKVAFEFDGSYWHRNSVDRDTAKTRLLQAHGWTVIRLRKDPALPDGLPDISGAVNARTNERNTSTIALDAHRAIRSAAPLMLMDADAKELRSYAAERARFHRTTKPMDC